MKICVIIIFVAFMLFIQVTPIFADEKSDKANAMYADAAKHFAKGKYREAVVLYDKILQNYPNNITVLKMKGVAESNLGYHQKSLVNFYKVYQKDPKDVVSLLGLGVGFGNFGEYLEAKKYFDTAYNLHPNSTVAKNYKEFADKTIKKYPYKPTEKPKKTEMDTKTFESYVRKVSSTVSKEKRYIEYPNPSFDVIKKFLRDYEKWNFEQQIKTDSSAFPNPTVTQNNNTYVLNYKVFVNKQPTGLPLDHVGTLNNSTKYWESQAFNSNKGKAAVKFSSTDTKAEASIWVTWTVRKLGEGVLGHAHVGKGVVEVALGDYNCDGSFQLYDVNSVEKIMRHELGHSIGLGHSEDTSSIMYPSMKPKYAYCLLN
ncbi:MAG: matrixin family metalloprotease [Thaumarchaeota archaeon]|nr:matrixin family metalloprotease [Nitrososphaerota archaeon]